MRKRMSCLDDNACQTCWSILCPDNKNPNALNKSKATQSPETPCLEAHIPIVAQKPLGVAAAALGGVRDNSASNSKKGMHKK